MKKIGSRIFRFLSLLSFFSLFSTGGAAFASPPAQVNPSDRLARFQEVSPETRARFEGGMSVDEFLVLSGGRVPNSLKQFAGQEVSVVIEMEAVPLAGLYAQQLQTSAPLSPAAQQAYHTSLLSAQATVASSVQVMGGRVISQYTKAYNGLLVRLPAGQLQSVLRLPGVKAIHKAPRHVPSLANSVALIRATQVVEELGLDGTGTTIAIIDSGVDYTHAAFGGPGTPEAYEANDPAVIEPGTFPTAKVIGGYDFAGAAYDSSSADPAVNTPQPDPDPLDGDRHGTHVASTAAGIAVEGSLSHGVAPGALIYALKVFGEPAGGSELAINAIEWSVDPNQDNDLSDHVDVINMSLGEDYGVADPLDPANTAVEYASDVGIVVVASSGNAGDVSYITGDPAGSRSAISVAASTTGFLTGPTISIEPSTELTRTQFTYSEPAFDENTGLFTETLSAPLAYTGNLFADDLLCEIPPEAAGTTPLAGMVALIQRGTCGFSDKVNNAATLGAVAAIIYNSAAGGNELLTMAGPPVAIPAGFVARDDGLILIQVDGMTVTISAVNEATILPDPYTPADTIASFSSRGPLGQNAVLKPDVTAPGVSIYAARMGSGDEGVAISGTSMASPHVAGVAALVRQAHPDWSPEQVKAVIMNTAVDLATGSAEVPRQGAGRVDAYRAVTENALAIGDEDEVALNWGVIPVEENSYLSSKSILLHDLSGSEPEVYDVSVVWGENSPEAGVQLTVPTTVEVTPQRRFANLEVGLAVDATQIEVGFQQLEEYYGYVVLTSQADPAHSLRVPFYLIPQPYSRLSVSEPRFTWKGTAEVRVTHQGPVASSLAAFPLYEFDENEPEQPDHADLRMVGMDAGFTDPDYGELFIPAMNVYGSWFTPQPYFAEFDLYLDLDQDGEPDLVNFNWNLGAASGGDDTDEWVVIQVNLATLEVSLASPFLIFTDYNSGYMEWGLPALWNGLDPAADTDFNWQLFVFDGSGMEDSSAGRHFDVAHPPFEFEWQANPGPENPTVTVTVRIKDLEGLIATQPLGMMLVDYNGKPGEGQAYGVFRPDKSFVNLIQAGEDAGELFLPFLLHDGR